MPKNRVLFRITDSQAAYSPLSDVEVKLGGLWGLLNVGELPLSQKAREPILRSSTWRRATIPQRPLVMAIFANYSRRLEDDAYGSGAICALSWPSKQSTSVSARRPLELVTASETQASLRMAYRLILPSWRLLRATSRRFCAIKRLCSSIPLKINVQVQADGVVDATRLSADAKSGASTQSEGTGRPRL